MLDVIKLTPLEWHICKYQATQRMNKDRSKIADRKIGTQSSEFTDIEGFAAELALCKWYGNYPHWQLTAQSRIDDGADVIINGWRIDVKVSKYFDARLLAAMHKKISGADIFVLMCGSATVYAPYGWCFTRDLMNYRTVTNLGYGNGYALTQQQLRAMPDLRQVLTERKSQ